MMMFVYYRDVAHSCQTTVRFETNVSTTTVEFGVVSERQTSESLAMKLRGMSTRVATNSGV